MSDLTGQGEDKGEQGEAKETQANEIQENAQNSSETINEIGCRLCTIS